MFHKESVCRLSPAQIEEEAQSLLHQMTLKEKIWMLNGNWDTIQNTRVHQNPYNPTPICTNGVPRLGISPIAFTDGPRGVVMGHSTCFPVSMARGASFDRSLERRVGDVIGKEARAQGANYFAGVCINLLRHPAWGRAQETYGEDPYLLGEMAAALVEAVQVHNVMACLKHYAMNNIENSRFFVDVQVDERSLREVYLPHFRKGVEAGAASLMGAYNLVNGDQACESQTLLTDILRDEWGFEGFTISDFLYGVRNTHKALSAGLDIEMPMPIHYNQRLLQAVKRGHIPLEQVERAVLRVLRTLLVFENCPDPQSYPPEVVAAPEHIALACEAAEKSMVLIKNDGNILPFSREVKRILLLGRLAAQENTGDHGSSRIFAPYVVTPLAGLQAYFGDAVEIIYLQENQVEQARELASQVDCVVIIAGNDFNDEGEFISPGGMDEMLAPILAGYRNQGMPFKALLLQLLIRFAPHLVSGESSQGAGGDRSSLSLKPEQAALIRAVGGINPNTVVSLVCGSMILLDDWAEKVPAVLYSWYAGMEGGHALARLLFGEVNPSGKLPFSIPTHPQHLPYFSNRDGSITYDLYHGYSKLEKDGHAPAYPFGFGLSYTRFEFINLSVEDAGDTLQVRVQIHNCGQRDGEEVAQVYVGMQNSQGERPAKLLKGFEKVSIRAGEIVTVTIAVRKAELRYYHVEEKRWVLEPGIYRILVGPHSGAEALLEAQIRL